MGRRFLHALQRLQSSLSALRLAFEREKKTQSHALVVLPAKSRQISTWKIWFRPSYTKDFSWNNLPKLPKFQRKNIPNCQIFCDKFQLVAKNIEGFCFLSTFISRPWSNLAKLFSERSPVWLHHKILQKTLIPCGSCYTIVCREGECTSSMLHTLSISSVGIMPLYVTLLQTWCLFSSVCWCTRPACCVQSIAHTKKNLLLSFALLAFRFTSPCSWKQTPRPWFFSSYLHLLIPCCCGRKFMQHKLCTCTPTSSSSSLLLSSLLDKWHASFACSLATMARNPLLTSLAKPSKSSQLSNVIWNCLWNDLLNCLGMIIS